MDWDSLSFVLVLFGTALAAFIAGTAYGIRFSGRRYRHAITMIDGTVFRRDHDKDGDGEGEPVEFDPPRR